FPRPPVPAVRGDACASAARHRARDQRPGAHDRRGGQPGRRSARYPGGAALRRGRRADDGAVGATFATPLPAVLVAAGPGLAAAGGAQTILWDQRDLVSGDGIPDQDFEAELDEFDAEAADDFLVDWPDGWRVEVVYTIGDQSLERS